MRVKVRRVLWYTVSGIGPGRHGGVCGAPARWPLLTRMVRDPWGIQGMTLSELHTQVQLGEDSRRQFKANVHNAEALAAEMAAFANGEGGFLHPIAAFAGRDENGNAERKRDGTDRRRARSDEWAGRHTGVLHPSQGGASRSPARRSREFASSFPRSRPEIAELGSSNRRGGTQFGRPSLVCRGSSAV